MIGTVGRQSRLVDQLLDWLADNLIIKVVYGKLGPAQLGPNFPGPKLSDIPDFQQNMKMGKCSIDFVTNLKSITGDDKN